MLTIKWIAEDIGAEYKQVEYIRSDLEDDKTFTITRPTATYKQQL